MTKLLVEGFIDLLTETIKERFNEAVLIGGYYEDGLASLLVHSMDTGRELTVYVPIEGLKEIRKDDDKVAAILDMFSNAWYTKDTLDQY